MSTDDSRERLLTAAGPIFAAKGYERATVREICAAAGVNPASINYHFGDKHRLYVETIKRAHRRRMESAPVPVWPECTTAEERLFFIVRSFMHRILREFREQWETELMLREILRPTQACRELVEEYIRPEFELLLDVLGQLLPRDVPNHRLLKLGLGVIGQCIHYRVGASIVWMMVDEDSRSRYFDAESLAVHIWESTLSVAKGFHDRSAGRWQPPEPPNAEALGGGETMRPALTVPTSTPHSTPRTDLIHEPQT